MIKKIIFVIIFLFLCFTQVHAGYIQNEKHVKVDVCPKNYYEFSNTHVLIMGRCSTIIYQGDWGHEWLYRGELQYVDTIVSLHDGADAYLYVVIRDKTKDGDILLEVNMLDGGVGSNNAYSGVYFWGAYTGYSKYTPVVYMNYYAKMTSVRVDKINPNSDIDKCYEYLQGAVLNP